MKIKMLSMELAIDVFELLKPEFKKKLINTFKDKIANLHEDEVFAFSRYCGPLYVKLLPILEKNNSLQISSSFLTYFRELASWKSETVRKNFLFNLPGILTCTDPKYFSTLKHKYFKMLEDKSLGVRIAVFVSLHEVLGFLMDEEVLIAARPLVLKAMKSNQALEISKIIAENLKAYVGLFVPKARVEPNEKLGLPSLDQEFFVNFEWMNPLFSSTPLSKTAEDIEFISAIPILWKNISSLSNWRVESQLISQLESSMGLISPNSFVTYCLSFVWQRLRQGNKQIQAKCIGLLISTVHVLFRRDIIKFLMKQMVEQFLRSKHYKERSTYLIFASECFNHFSRELLRTYFFTQLLELENEPINHVKLQFITLLPTFRTSLSQEEDSVIIEKTNQIITSWQSSQKLKLLKEKLIEARDQIRYRVGSKEFMSSVEEAFLKRKSKEDSKFAEEVKEIEEIKKRSLAEITKEANLDSSKQAKKPQVTSKTSSRPFYTSHDLFSLSSIIVAV